MDGLGLGLGLTSVCVCVCVCFFPEQKKGAQMVEDDTQIGAEMLFFHFTLF